MVPEATPHKGAQRQLQQSTKGDTMVDKERQAAWDRARAEHEAFEKQVLANYQDRRAAVMTLVVLLIVGIAVAALLSPFDVIWFAPLFAVPILVARLGAKWNSRALRREVTGY